MTLPTYKAKGSVNNALTNSQNYKLAGSPATITLTNAGPPTNGTTGVGVANPGQLLIDVTNGVAYVNTGSMASPTWVVIGGNSTDQQTIATGLTASATQTLAGSTKLTATRNFVTTSATSGNSVGLPNMQPGQVTTIFNDGANPIKVFPFAGTIAIDGGSAGASVTLTNGKRANFYCTSATTVESAQLGVASA